MRPITPQPGYTISDFKTLLASKRFIYVDCYTITPKYGSVIRLVNAQSPVTLVPLSGGAPVTYESRSGLRISGIKLHVGVGTSVDEQDLVFEYDQTATQWGLPFARGIILGRLDGASVSRDRFVASSWGSPWVGGIPMFRGQISSADKISRTSATVKVKSDLVLLNIQYPKDVYQPGCVHTLFDPGCLVDRASNKTIGSVGSGSTASVINWSGALTKFKLGTIYITNSSGITLVRTIRDASTTQLFLAYPLEDVPVTGTSFDAYPGCDRTYATCGSRFSNTQHFKGFPFVPVAETAY